MKFSIITVNYNNRAGLEKTIESVLGQTCKDYEYIIIDGGSTDGSREVIARVQDRLSYWCSEPDKGIYNAMNKGIAKAKGEYLNFMNSGDTFATMDALKEVYESGSNADIIYGYMVRYHIDGPINNAPLMKDRLEWHDFTLTNLPHQSTFFRRSLFDTIGLYDESYTAVADLKFNILAIVFSGCTYKFIQSKISIYEGGGFSDNPDLLRQERARLRSELLPKMVTDDIGLLQMTKLIRERVFFRKLYTLLYMAAVYSKDRKWWYALKTCVYRLLCIDKVRSFLHPSH